MSHFPRMTYTCSLPTKLVVRPRYGGRFNREESLMKKAILVVGGLIVLSLLSLAVSYNHLVSLSQQVNSQWAQVQNVYQRRADLIPNLVQTVQGSANFEKSTLTAVTQARASVGRVQLP